MKKLLITYDENTADGGEPINMFDYVMNEFENSDIEATLLELPEQPSVLAAEVKRAIDALSCEGEFAHLANKSSGDQIDSAHEILTAAMAADTVDGDPAARMSRALRSVMECLGNWMEIADQDDKRQYDQDAMDEAQLALDAYNACAGEPTPPTMAERWVKLYEAWQDDAENQVYDFPEWLDQYRPGERETLTWIASWDARPVDACLKADPRRATAFAIMDFGDGSIAIRRSPGYEHDPQWMVAS